MQSRRYLQIRQEAGLPLARPVRLWLGRIRRKVQFIWDGQVGPLPRPEKWVFIVGCYNSGTTLLNDMIAIHPDVGSMPKEGQFYTDELVLPRRVGLIRLWALKPDLFYMDENSGQDVDVNRLKRQWGAHFNDPTRPVLLEKSPTNAARTRWLQEHFENAHFIGIIRNGYAVAEGIHRKAGHPLDIAATQWARSNEIMLRDFELLDKKKVIRYERLCDSPDGTLQEILEFLGLNPRGLDVGSRIWQIHERASPIRNMNYQSLAALNSEEREVIEATAGDMLSRLDYNFERL